MRVVHGIVCALAVALLVPAGARAQDADRIVAGGGITAPGWKGEVDPASAKAGRTVADSKFAKDGDTLRLTIGPAAVYWNPANTAKGDFTIKALFSETGMGVRSGHPQHHDDLHARGWIAAARGQAPGGSLTLHWPPRLQPLSA